MLVFVEYLFGFIGNFTTGIFKILYLFKHLFTTTNYILNGSNLFCNTLGLNLDISFLHITSQNILNVFEIKLTVNEIFIIKHFGNFPCKIVYIILNVGEYNAQSIFRGYM
jgi:hypothetical protein